MKKLRSKPIIINPMENGRCVNDLNFFTSFIALLLPSKLTQLLNVRLEENSGNALHTQES